MPLIAEDSVREIRDAADLAELVRGRVTLTRRGNRWVGRCPFHEERTPSFGLIPPENRWYYCHGCGAKGDAVDWMMQKEGAATFAEAIEGLAERFGVTVRYAQTSPEEDARRRADQRRMALRERAAQFYAEYLWRAGEARTARDYLLGRGFDEALLRAFRVGYAPGSGSELTRRALAQGYTREELADAGLGRQGGRNGDFFAARITFPITDLRGRVVGFGARTLDPAQRAKYVNSPEGRGFHKRRLLFGLAQARQAAATAGHMLVVEGYTDVLALAKAGIPNAVACMGTSLTLEQIQELRRAASRIRLCFDADAAGEAAAWRTAEAAGEHVTDLDVVPLPPGRDPGDMAADPQALSALSRMGSDFVPLVTFLVQSRARRAGSSSSERQSALEDITRLLRRIPDSVEKDEGVRLTAGLLRVSRPMEERLREASRQGGPRTGPAATAPMPVLDAERRRERRLLALAAAMPEAGPQVLAAVPDEALAEPEHRRARALLAQGSAPEGWPDDLQDLALALRAEEGVEGATRAELDEVAYRVQLPALLREQGDEEGRLHVLDLIRRLRAALRGDE